MPHSSEALIGPEENYPKKFSPGSITKKKRSRHLPWIDRIGAVLAGMCALHCIAFMMGSFVLGFTASSLFFNPGLRWLMVFLVACLSVGSLFLRGKHHGQGFPAWLVVVGLAAIIAANLWGIWAIAGEVLSLCGGFILAAGHLTQLSRDKRTNGPTRASKSHFMARKFALLLLMVACVMALFQLPSVSRISYLWGGDPSEAQGEEGTIGWKLLTQLDVYSGEVGPELEKVIGGRVKIPGFIVPLDESGKTFLLAPYAGACIHGPTPPANQIIFVVMQPLATPIDPWGWDPIWVTGTLEITAIDSPFGSAGFKMNGIDTEIYR